MYSCHCNPAPTITKSTRTAHCTDACGDTSANHCGCRTLTTIAPKAASNVAPIALYKNTNPARGQTITGTDPITNAAPHTIGNACATSGGNKSHTCFQYPGQVVPARAGHCHA